MVSRKLGRFENFLFIDVNWICHLILFPQTHADGIYISLSGHGNQNQSLKYIFLYLEMAIILGTALPVASF